jgi:carboxypeptidase Taq
MAAPASQDPPRSADAPRADSPADRDRHDLALLLAQARRTAALASVEALLGWDEQTMLPPEGAEYRATQASSLAAIVHAGRTDPEHIERIGRLAASPLATGDGPEGVAIRRLKSDSDKQSRLPGRLVEELAGTCVRAQAAWVEARRTNRWAVLEPWLERVFALKREQAACQLPDRDAYDALLDDYEPGARWRSVHERFERLRDGIIPMLEAFETARERPDDSLARRTYPRASQEAFVRRVAEAIGFDFRRGRLDTAEHPFCSTAGPHDCRITTRWDERNLSTALYGVLHEAGHGLYEQGLPTDWYGLPPGEACSLGIHESQSRLWENLVGRSPAFWEWCFPLASAAFPSALSDASPAGLQRAMMVVRRSFIRVEADEVTYNLHVMMRSDLERELVLGRLAVGDLPGAWNERFERDFGLRPPDDTAGVLQDIHWSAGLVGYFPTYTLGTMHASQLMAAAERDLPGLDEAFRAGRFEGLLDWLRVRVHRLGREVDSDPLVERASGGPPSERWLLESLRDRYGAAHGL